MRAVSSRPTSISNSNLLPSLDHAYFSTIPLPSSSSSSSPNIDHLKRTHAKLLRTGEFDDTLSAGKLVSDIASSHPSNLPYARAVFARIRSPLNTFTWNSLIRAYAHGPSPEGSFLLFRLMLSRDFPPNHYTYPFLLKASSRLPDPRLGLSLHASLLRRGFEDSDRFVQAALLTFYASRGSLDVARRLFDRCPSRDVATWNAIIKGYVAAARYTDAVRLFAEMQGGGDEITMLSVVSACAHLGALDMGRWAHAYVDRNRLRVTLNLRTALLNMYARCGEIDAARALFRGSGEKDVRAWSAMIGGLAVHGLAKEALEVYAEMQAAGIKPDSVTITAVLSACSHGGLVREGMQILDSMASDYSVQPTIQHYGCVVDMLGRAGELEEALCLIRRIPLEPDVALWGALLVACRVRKNVEMGEMVAKEILELDPCHAGAHVFLSNVYAAGGRWGLVEEVRNSMSEQKISKPPGSSLIELDGGVHEFLSGDHSHPQCHEIYKMLDDFGRLRSLKGHNEPATKGISFDIDEEDKEVCLSQHSEKLAVAFALINTRPGTAIRIVKNLRICEDCHSLMKLVSVVYKRDVIVRDRNRFHHFKEGSCSCRDYW